MEITLPKQLAITLDKLAKLRGQRPEELAIEAIQARFPSISSAKLEHEAWKRKLAEAASDCGVSLSNESLSSEGLYE